MKVQLSPEELAKAHVPAIKALAAKKLEDCLMDVVKPYIQEMLRDSMKPGAKVQADYDSVTHKMRFIVEVEYEDIASRY